MPTSPDTDLTSPLLIDETLPDDPNLRAVTDDVLAKLCYSLTAAAADEDQPADSDSLHLLFRGFLATRKAPTRERARVKARTLLKTPQLRKAHFGRYAAVNLKDYAKLGSDGMDSQVRKLKIDSAGLKKSLDGLRPRLVRRPSASNGNGAPQRVVTKDAPKRVVIKKEPAATAPKRVARKAPVPKKAAQKAPVPKKPEPKPDPDLTAGLAFKKLRLYIREVRCIVETDEAGSDEISMGGAIIRASGKTTPVKEFVVSRDFDQGERHRFKSDKVFGAWNLKTQSGFPYAYTAAIAMAEKDDGGFYDFLKKLWAKVGELVQKALAGLVGGAIGAAVGSNIFPGLGTVVGAVIGATLGWLINLFDNQDDIVGIKMAKIALKGCTKSYYDKAKLTSPHGAKQTLVFKGDGGRYDVDVAWKVAAT